MNTSDKVNTQKAILVLNLLKQEFPKCFIKGEDKRPLKIGIHLDLIEHYKNDERFTEDELDLAIYFYTHGKRYLQLIIEEADRIDIQGNPVEKVSAIHAQYASRLLEKRHKQAKDFQKDKELEAGA